MSTPRARGAVLLLPLALLLPACSVKKTAVNALGNALASGGSIYASDDDPELVAAAVPFGLKTIDALLETSPSHEGLLLAAASGYTQYAYAFVQVEADYVEAKDFARATELRARARKLYRRAMDYGLRGLEAEHRGFLDRLRLDRAGLLAEMKPHDVPLLYWAAAPWAALTSLSKEDSELTADQGIFEAMMRRALELEPRYNAGAIHDFFISFEGGRPPAAGGSTARAREHLKAALQISGGHRAAPYVSFAETVSVGAQDRKEFEEMLRAALAVEVDAVPQHRLANLVSQRRARWLLARADELFLE